MVLRSDVLIGRRYLAIRGAKQKAKIRSGQEKFAGTHRVRRCYILVRGESAAEMAVAPSRSRSLTFRQASLCAASAGFAVRWRFSQRYNAVSRSEDHEHEQTRSDRICGLLRELHIESTGVRRIERFGIPAITDATVVCRAKRAGRKLSVCAGKMDGEGSSRAHHGYRAYFCVPGVAHRAWGSNAATRIRAG